MTSATTRSKSGMASIAGPLAFGVVGSLATLVFVSSVKAPLLWLELGVLFGLGLWFLLRDAGRQKFEFLSVKNCFIVVYLLEFGAGTISQMLGMNSMLPAIHTWGDQQTLVALAYCIVGLLCFGAAYYSRLGPAASSALPRFAEGGDVGRAAAMIALLSLASFASVYALMTHFGSIEYYLTHVEIIRATEFTGVGYLLYGVYLIPKAFLVCYGLSLSKRRFEVAALILFLSSIIVGVLAGLRAEMFEAIAYAFLVRHYSGFKIQLGPKILAAAMAAYLASSVYVLYRIHPADTVSRQLAVTADAISHGELTKGDALAVFARFNGLASVVRVLDRLPEVGHTWGKDNLIDLITMPIPRFLWPNKPLPAPVKFNQEFYPEIPYEMTSTGAAAATTSVGELTWMFGLPGVMGGLFLIGLYCRAIGHYLATARSAPVAVLASLSSFYALLMNEMFELQVIQFLIYGGLLVFVMRWVYPVDKATIRLAPARRAVTRNPFTTERTRRPSRQNEGKLPANSV